MPKPKCRKCLDTGKRIAEYHQGNPLMDWCDCSKGQIMKQKERDESDREFQLKRENIRLKEELLRKTCKHPRGFRNSGRGDYRGLWIMECPICHEEEFNWASE
jgi:hypothetical protein